MKIITVKINTCRKIWSWLTVVYRRYKCSLIIWIENDSKIRNFAFEWNTKCEFVLLNFITFIVNKIWCDRRSVVIAEPTDCWIYHQTSFPIFDCICFRYQIPFRDWNHLIVEFIFTNLFNYWDEQMNRRYQCWTQFDWYSWWFTCNPQFSYDSNTTSCDVGKLTSDNDRMVEDFS